MKIRTLIAILLPVSAPLVPAKASNAASGTISNVIVLRQGVLLFNQNGSRGAPPSCAVATGRWAISLAQGGGSGVEALILTAYSQGKSIIISGTGGCEDWGDTETVQYVQIAN